MMLITGMLISGKMSVAMLQQRERRRQHDQHRHHDERVRAPQRQLDHRHGALLPEGKRIQHFGVQWTSAAAREALIPKPGNFARRRLTVSRGRQRADVTRGVLHVDHHPHTRCSLRRLLDPGDGAAPAQAWGRHGGHFHGGGWGPGLLWGGIGLGIGLGALSYAYAAPYPGYTVVVPPPAYYPPPVAYYRAPPATYYNNQPAPQAPPDPIFYPNRGQTPAQTEADRRACNRWATTQPSAMNDASVFQRATLACMEGRGYTVR